MIPNGQILSHNTIIATVQDGEIVTCDESLLPLYLLRTKDAESWLCSRAIDSHRTNSRLIKRALRIAQADDLAAVLKVHGATITDTYWFRAEGENLAWEDVRFTQNEFAELALRGDPDSFSKPYSPTPELTNTGSYEKCWRLTEFGWQMLKSGNDLERFSEAFVAYLGIQLGFHMAEYEDGGNYVISPDFTNNAAVCFESVDGIIGDNEDYGDNFNAFYDISPELAQQYLQIIYLDTLCFNMDRHTKNYGVLRDPQSGKILSMAPNFDNNIALFSRGIPQNLSRENDKLIELFTEFLEQNGIAKAMAVDLPQPTNEQITAAAVAAGRTDLANISCEFVGNGSVVIEEFLAQENGMIML